MDDVLGLPWPKGPDGSMFSNRVLQNVNQTLLQQLGVQAGPHVWPLTSWDHHCTSQCHQSPRDRETPLSSSPGITLPEHLPSLGTPSMLQHALPRLEHVSPMLGWKHACSLHCSSPSWPLPPERCPGKPFKQHQEGTSSNATRSLKHSPRPLHFT